MQKRSLLSIPFPTTRTTEMLFPHARPLQTNLVGTNGHIYGRFLGLMQLAVMPGQRVYQDCRYISICRCVKLLLSA